MSASQNHKPHVRVANQDSRFIDEVDGVRSTHTRPKPHHDQKVSERVSSAAPRPLEAKGLPAAPAVAAMVTIVLSAFVTALWNVLAEHPDRSAIAAGSIGALGVFCALVSAPALSRAVFQATASRSAR